MSRCRGDELDSDFTLKLATQLSDTVNSRNQEFLNANLSVVAQVEKEHKDEIVGLAQDRVSQIIQQAVLDSRQPTLREVEQMKMEIQTHNAVPDVQHISTPDPSLLERPMFTPEDLRSLATLSAPHQDIIRAALQVRVVTIIG